MFHVRSASTVDHCDVIQSYNPSVTRRFNNLYLPNKWQTSVKEKHKDLTKKTAMTYNIGSHTHKTYVVTAAQSSPLTVDYKP